MSFEVSIADDRVKRTVYNPSDFLSYLSDGPCENRTLQFSIEAFFVRTIDNPEKSTVPTPEVLGILKQGITFEDTTDPSAPKEL